MARQTSTKCECYQTYGLGGLRDTLRHVTQWTPHHILLWDHDGPQEPLTFPLFISIATVALVTNSTYRVQQQTDYNISSPLRLHVSDEIINQ